MLKGLFSAASGMRALEMYTDTAANNLANVNTAGFKRSNVQFMPFAEVMINRLHHDDQQGVGAYASGTVVPGTPVDHRQGAMVATGNVLDVAISGDGFYQIQTDEGQTGYTRNGTFTLNALNQLSTHDGHLLLANGEPITIPSRSAKIEIKPNGTVYADAQPVGQITLVGIEDKATLLRAGENMFFATENTAFTSVDGVLQQGYIERSNVNVIEELINNIKGQRMYESLKTSITTQDQTLAKAMEMGQVR